MLQYITYLSLLASAWSAPLERRSINGPVISSNFPDPSFIEVDGTYYAFGTQGSNGVPVATSTDFNSWSVSGTPALTGGGSWSNGQDLWAPSVSRIGNQFVMYYTAKKSDGSTHCVGVATSSSPAGPYDPQGSALVCDDAGGGAIDPFGFTDADGSNWLLWKVDGNSLGHGGSCNNGVAPYVSTPIMAQKLSGDGLSVEGGATQILDRDDGDGPLVEAPALLQKDGVYFLFFSSGCYAESTYDSSYAVSTSGVLGPYTKAGAPTAPLLLTGKPSGSLYAPGGLSVGVNGDNKVVFHADQGTTADVRQMYVGTLNIDTGARTVSL